MTTTNTPVLLDVKTVAARLSVCPLTVRNHIKRGTIQGVKVGRRVLVPDEWLAEFIRSNVIVATNEKGDATA